MANYSIPNSTPAIGRTSTPLSRRSKKQNKLSAIGNPQSAIRRVKGAWWSSRSSKPLSVPHTRDRGRFDSYPLRLNFSRHPERSEAGSKDPVAVSQSNSSVFLGFVRNDEHRKGGDPHVA